MVRIRLKRTGVKNRPSYRIVVADARAPRDGRFIEVVGDYHPIGNPPLHLKEDRIVYWLKQGAQPTQKVRALLRHAKITIP